MKIIELILDKFNPAKLRGDKTILAVVITLTLFSLILVYSSSSALAYREGSTNLFYLFKQLGFSIIGLICLVGCYYIPLRKYRDYTTHFFIASIILLILTLTRLGIEINGAKRWLGVAPFIFQPAELAKIAIVLYIARALEKNQFTTFKSFLLIIVVPLGFIILLILAGSVSAAIFTGIISLVMLVIAKVKSKYILKSGGIGIVLVGVIILLNLSFGLFPRLDTGYKRIQRKFQKIEITEDLTPQEKQKILDENFQARMAEIAISSVGITGKGPGKSTQRNFLPHPYSDYAYTIVIEEYGLIGGVFILFIYLIFLYRCITLAKRCSRPFTALSAGGFGLLITAQAFLHIYVNVGIGPVTGQTLPLISTGGTSAIFISCAFGIVLSVSRAIEEEYQASLNKKESKDNNKRVNKRRLEEKDEKIGRENRVEKDEKYQIIAPNGEFK